VVKDGSRVVVSSVRGRFSQKMLNRTGVAKKRLDATKWWVVLDGSTDQTWFYDDELTPINVRVVEGTADCQGRIWLDDGTCQTLLGPDDQLKRYRITIEEVFEGGQG
jgi:hypothetical protein